MTVKISKSAAKEISSIINGLLVYRSMVEKANTVDDMRKAMAWFNEDVKAAQAMGINIHAFFEPGTEKLIDAK